MNFFKTTILIGSLLFNSLCIADEPLSVLMQQLKSDSAIKIRYQETRHLELVDDPWQGNGFLYSLAPNIMIREQLTPKHLLTGIKDNQMYYFNPENKQYYQTEFDDNSPENLHIAVFKALINADEAMLQRLYDIQFSYTDTAWVINLNAKKEAKLDLKIIIFGLPKQMANTIRIIQEGEVTEFDLQQEAEGIKVYQAIEHLSTQLIRK